MRIRIALATVFFLGGGIQLSCSPLETPDLQKLRKRDELCCPVDTCQQKFLGYAELFFHLFVYADGDASSSSSGVTHAYSEEHRYVLSNLAWQFACKA